MPINVTKTFLPPFEEYTSILKRAWDKAWMTNNGELVQELEESLKRYLDIDHLLFCNNGTIVLQMALKALDIKGEVITTPFSYVATTTALLWENCTPVFVDIDNTNFCIDPFKIEAAITDKTQAILATHVYGYPCDVEAIDNIAKKHNLKVIYDAAHAFGTQYKGKSIFTYGDISTCSFHATKLFHTGEGGCIIGNNKEIANRLMLYRQFGHIGDEYYSIGVNGKSSEFHAAMGLCNLPYIEAICEKRKAQWLYYQSLLIDKGLHLLSLNNPDIAFNYSYFPVVFSCEEELLKVNSALKDKQINARRYFFPSLNTLSYIENYDPCPIAESIAQRVLCLPLFYDLAKEDQDTIANVILKERVQEVIKCV